MARINSFISWSIATFDKDYDLRYEMNRRILTPENHITSRIRLEKSSTTKNHIFSSKRSWRWLNKILSFLPWSVLPASWVWQTAKQWLAASKVTTQTIQIFTLAFILQIYWLETFQARMSIRMSATCNHSVNKKSLVKQVLIQTSKLNFPARFEFAKMMMKRLFCNNFKEYHGIYTWL